MRHAMFDEHNDLGTPSSLNLIGEGCHYKEGDLKRRNGTVLLGRCFLLIPASRDTERHLYYICDVVS